MTAPATTTPRVKRSKTTAAPPPSLTPYAEARRLMTIAAPLIAAYLAEYVMFITTKLVVGELGYRELAAVGLGGSMAFEVMVVLAGLLSITGVLAAEAEGAGKKRDAGHAARQGLIVATILAIPFTIFVLNIDKVFAATGQDPDVTALVGPFAATLSGFALPVLLFTALRDFVAALSRTRAVMVIAAAAAPVNWALATGLVHGRFGLPEMGLAGAGLAITIVNWLMVGALFAYVYATPALRGYGVIRDRLRIDPAVMAVILRLGLPVAGLVAVEAGLFMAVGILSGVLGAPTLAAHQVLMGWIGVPFMIALALAEGSMVRVAHGVGRGDPAGARQAGLVGLGLGVAILAALVFAPLLLAEEITAIFIPEADPGFAEVSAIVVALMSVAAIFQVFDGAQVIMARSLRGVRDGFYPLWIGTFGYWGLGIGGGWLLAFPLGWGGVGLWTGLAVGITATACLLTIRFLIIARRRIQAAGSSAVGEAPDAPAETPAP